MGRRGPAPTPTAILKMQGSWQGKARDKTEPKPSTKTPACPSWLLPVAKRMWKEIVPELRRCGLLTSIDGKALAAYCQAWARWREAEEKLTKYGPVYTVTDSNGNTHTVKQASLARTLLETMRRYQCDFGVNPSSRSRVVVNDPGAGERGDAFDGFVKSKTR